MVSWIRRPWSQELNRMAWPRITRRTVARPGLLELLHLGEAQLRRETHRAVVGGLSAQYRQPKSGPSPYPRAGRARPGRPGRFPRSLRFARRRRSPALPLRHRHGYAAGFHRGLPADIHKPAQEFPAP